MVRVSEDGMICNASPLQPVTLDKMSAFNNEHDEEGEACCR